MMDKISKLVADALGQARAVRKRLETKVIPLLEPRQRTTAVAISRQIEAKTIMEEALLRDIKAFIMLIGEEVEDGSTLAWHGREHDPESGYYVLLRTERARALLITQDELAKLATAIEAALDGAEAYTIANALLVT
ncbi:hypothetical protein O4G76_15385 [Limimaricola sp. G21655-S1]|uniref:hypothetical protein n=1 Tax=Limimaricola sp. G21655-S1 TaxID=3014768 RepID=UPI0022AFDA7A|nr:hypothetical protein [Limimaricola sp. G21655-S1]MCZ4262224.1 hypothetical protein [Limimaricola sp. G21655-S1]